MIVALYALAGAMILGGTAAVYQGYGIVMVERGWTLVIAGTVAVGSGAVLAGVTHLASRVARLQADLSKLRERFGRLDPTALRRLPPAPPAAVVPAPRGPMELGVFAPEAREPAPASPSPAFDEVALRGTAGPPERDEERVAPELEAASEPDEPTAVGSYESGGNRYVMFSDGSIEAHTATGVYRFKSLDELKAFIAAGGEGPPVPA